MSYGSKVFLFIILAIIFSILNSCGKMLGIIDDPADKKAEREKTRASEEYKRK